MCSFFQLPARQPDTLLASRVQCGECLPPVTRHHPAWHSPYMCRGRKSPSPPIIGGTRARDTISMHAASSLAIKVVSHRRRVAACRSPLPSVDSRSLWLSPSFLLPFLPQLPYTFLSSLKFAPPPYPFPAMSFAIPFLSVGPSIILIYFPFLSFYRFPLLAVFLQSLFPSQGFLFIGPSIFRTFSSFLSFSFPSNSPSCLPALHASMSVSSLSSSYSLSFSSPHSS